MSASTTQQEGRPGAPSDGTPRGAHGRGGLCVQHACRRQLSPNPSRGPDHRAGRSRSFLSANGCSVVPRGRRKPRVRANPRVDAGWLGSFRWLCTLGFAGTRGRLRPAGAVAALGRHPGRSDGGRAGSAGAGALELVYGADPRVSRRSPARATLGAGPRRLGPGPARASSSSPPLQEPQRRRRSFTDPETSSIARPMCSTRTTPWSWGWTTS